MGEAGFKQFMRLQNQLVVATENFSREENLSPVQMTIISKETGSQSG